MASDEILPQKPIETQEDKASKVDPPSLTPAGRLRAWAQFGSGIAGRAAQDLLGVMGWFR